MAPCSHIFIGQVIVQRLVDPQGLASNYTSLTGCIQCSPLCIDERPFVPLSTISSPFLNDGARLCVPGTERRTTELTATTLVKGKMEHRDNDFNFLLATDSYKVSDAGRFSKVVGRVIADLRKGSH